MGWSKAWLPKKSGVQAKPKARRGVPNGVEQQHGAWLAGLKQIGEIRDYGFEVITLRPIPTVTYTPDYTVWMKDGSVEYHETKGYEIHEATIVRMKLCADRFPHATFRLYQYERGKDRKERLIT
mgnify:CR=1 FL=1